MQIAHPTANPENARRRSLREKLSPLRKAATKSRKAISMNAVEVTSLITLPAIVVLALAKPTTNDENRPASRPPSKTPIQKTRTDTRPKEKTETR